MTNMILKQLFKPFKPMWFTTSTQWTSTQLGTYMHADDYLLSSTCSNDHTWPINMFIWCTHIAGWSCHIQALELIVDAPKCFTTFCTYIWILMVIDGDWWLESHCMYHVSRIHICNMSHPFCIPLTFRQNPYWHHIITISSDMCVYMYVCIHIMVHTYYIYL